MGILKDIITLVKQARSADLNSEMKPGRPGFRPRAPKGSRGLWRLPGPELEDLPPPRPRVKTSASVKAEITAARGGRMLQVEVDQQRCDGCGSCAVMCPDLAITVGGVARVDHDQCTACGACCSICARDAMTMVEESQ